MGFRDISLSGRAAAVSPLLMDRYIILLVLVVGTVELWKTRFFEEKGEEGAF